MTLGGKWHLGKSDDLRYQLTFGSGFSCYIGLGITADTGLDADGSLNSLGGVAGYLAWRHMFTSQLRANIFYSPFPKLSVPNSCSVVARSKAASTAT